MSVTLTIDEALLREAEKATNIHDWPTLVTTGLKALCQDRPSTQREAFTNFDFDATLAAAAALPDLTDDEFDQFEKEMNRPLPPGGSSCE
jgi:hypothetical protein